MVMVTGEKWIFGVRYRIPCDHLTSWPLPPASAVLRGLETDYERGRGFAILITFDVRDDWEFALFLEGVRMMAKSNTSTWFLLEFER